MTTHIQLRGTSGAGKSTAIFKVIDMLGEQIPHYIERRKHPLYYTFANYPVIIMGSYHTTFGGCDGIGSGKRVYSTITEVLPTLEDLTDKFILAEGLLLSEDVIHSCKLPNLKILYLDTTLEKCFDNIRERRARTNNEKPVNPRNTENRVKIIAKAKARLEALGVYCRTCSPNQAPKLIMGWINEKRSK